MDILVPFRQQIIKAKRRFTQQRFLIATGEGRVIWVSLVTKNTVSAGKDKLGEKEDFYLFFFLEIHLILFLELKFFTIFFCPREQGIRKRERKKF